MSLFEEKLNIVLFEGSPPRLIFAGGTSEGDINIVIRRNSGIKQSYQYENVPYAESTASEMTNLADKRNPKWLKIWQYLDKFRINVPPGK